MSHVYTISTPLHSRFWTHKIDRHLRNVLLVIAGVAGLTLASKINIPLKPVPITLQTLAVFFIGMTYGWRLGTTTVLAYIGIGALGLPVFSEPLPGSLVLVGLKAGYIWAWVPTVALCGWLAERGWGKHFFSVLTAQLIGLTVIFAAGITVLAQYIGWSMAIQTGFMPFILTGILKVIVLSLVIPKFWQEKQTST